MIKDMTCLFHSVKFFALTSSQLYSSHSEQIYRNEGTRISNHITSQTKERQNKHKGFSNTTKQKALKCKGVDVLEGDRWNVNSRESTDKEFPIQDYD